MVQAFLLLGGGVLSGIAGSVAGVASIVSFPLLISLGLAPISANVTNTCANGFTAVGVLASSRSELAGQGWTTVRLAVLTSLGGAAGATLLLLAPARSFAAAAPWLVAVASVLVMVQPRLAGWAASRRPDQAVAGPGRSPGRLLALAGVTVYTGYFGAASGVLALAVLSRLLPGPLARVNAVKNVVQGFANLVAAAGFAAFGPVHWGFVLPLALGYVGGGVVGPAVVRRLPGESLRLVVGVAGLVMAGYLLLR